eukprot:CAMPEP_0181139292 /NCGR_PEP_ID=MMETSP1071-20121207/34706_1 /TAXON_ID=35127 /ORGANISM="Thalassiosira sp., Strain NH16" /LENGTH=73 /DNA_ID=CAMNT_0023226193 /DNA_START=364 /DNA_END=586 /DNA_ORIENTATION=+
MTTIQIQAFFFNKACDMNSDDGICPTTPSHSNPPFEAIDFKAGPNVDADSDRFDSGSRTYLTFLGSTIGVAIE